MVLYSIESLRYIVVKGFVLNYVYIVLYLFIGFVYFILSALELGPTRFPPIPVTTLTYRRLY